MTVMDILTEWLKANGYDGLVSPDSECGCKIGDLVPCNESCDICRPAYRGPVPEGEAPDHHDGWCMYPSKAAVKEAKASIARVKAKQE